MLTFVVQAYIQKLGTCLLEVDECQNEEAEGALTKLSVEAASLVCCLSHFNGDTVKALHGLRLDNGEAVQQQPGDAFYVQLVVRIGKLCLCSYMTKTFLAVMFTYAFMCVLTCCMYDTTRHVSVGQCRCALQLSYHLVDCRLYGGVMPSKLVIVSSKMLAMFGTVKCNMTLRFARKICLGPSARLIYMLSFSILAVYDGVQQSCQKAW